jgi:hypothetical protein
LKTEGKEKVTVKYQNEKLTKRSEIQKKIQIEEESSSESSEDSEGDASSQTKTKGLMLF